MNHFFQTIPGWFSFRPLYERMVREAPDPAHFVEVGCWKGRSAAFMAVEIINSHKDILFDCIDTWNGSKEPKHLRDESVKNGTLYREFLKNVAPILATPGAPVLGIIRQSSVEASKLYPDESLDFVFIDAAHDYENVKADIAAWWPKIKPGGTLAGDDYAFKGVNAAVHELLKGHTVARGTGTGMQWVTRKS